MRKADRPRSTQRRALGAAVLSGVLGVIAVTSAIASADPSPKAKVTTLAATAGVPVTLPTTTTATTLAPTTTAPVPTVPPATIPAVAHPGDVAAALRYIAATQAPAADPAPAPTGNGSVEDAIATAFPDNYDKALRVARCESSLNPNAVSAGGGNWGLFQINKIHQPLVESMGYSWDQILDPYVNAAVARRIYDGSGWTPWGCRNA